MFDLHVYLTLKLHLLRLHVTVLLKVKLTSSYSRPVNVIFSNSCFILNEISTNFQSGISMSNQCGLDEGMSVGMQHELTMLQNKSSLAKALC